MSPTVSSSTHTHLMALGIDSVDCLAVADVTDLAPCVVDTMDALGDGFAVSAAALAFALAADALGGGFALTTDALAFALAADALGGGFAVTADALAFALAADALGGGFAVTADALAFALAAARCSIIGTMTLDDDEALSASTCT